MEQSLPLPGGLLGGQLHDPPQLIKEHSIDSPVESFHPSCIFFVVDSLELSCTEQEPDRRREYVVPDGHRLLNPLLGPLGELLSIRGGAPKEASHRLWDLDHTTMKPLGDPLATNERARDEKDPAFAGHVK